MTCSGSLPPAQVCDFVKVLDFRLVKSEVPSMAEPGLTAPNIVAGMPAYLSPETALGETVDHRTDVYAPRWT